MEPLELRRDIRRFANPLVSRSEAEQQHCRRIAFAMDERAHANLASLMATSPFPYAKAQRSTSNTAVISSGSNNKSTR